LVNIKVSKGTIFLNSQYDQNILKFMRSRAKRFWDKENREWQIPETELAALLQVLQGYEYNISYDEVKQAVTNEEPSKIFTCENLIPDWYEYKLQPYPYQVDGINYGLSHPKFLLADEPGLGKTKQILDLSQILKKQHGIKHVLIVTCVNSLKYNWYDEVYKHTGDKAFILGTRISKRGNASIGSNEDKLNDIVNINTGPAKDCFYLITNIETLRYVKRVQEPLKTKKNGVQRFRKRTIFLMVEALQKAIKDGDISMMVVDESHRVKNSASIQGEALLSLSCDYQVALTGTPVVNKPLDAYIPLKWLGFEEHSYYQFERHYSIKGGFGDHQIIGYKNLPELVSVLDKCMIRRLKTDVLKDLPEKIYINDYVEMTKEQIKLYEQIREQILTDVIDKVNISPNPLTTLIRLRQVTGNPNIISSQIKDNPKFDRMVQLVDDVVDNGGKCLIFSNWTNIIFPAYELLQKLGYQPAVYTGQNKKDREQERERFCKDEKCKVLLGTMDSIGVGFTLTEANTVIFLDEPWSRAAKTQCEDRVHRIGTKESPNIITIMCKGTIDERINDIVYKKGKMSDILIDKEEDILKNPNIINYLLDVK